MTQYDAALLVSCARAMSEVPTERSHELPVRIVTYYLAHRSLAESLCLRYGLAFMPPNKVSLPGGIDIVSLPPLKQVPSIKTLLSRR